VLGNDVLNLSDFIAGSIESDWGAEVLENVARVYSRHSGGVNLTCRDSVEDFSKELSKREVEHVVADLGSIYVKNPGSIKRLPGFESGSFWVQDASAALPAIILRNGISRISQNTETPPFVIDVCSAPGGKAMQMGSWGWDVEGVELVEKRAKRMCENIERCKLEENVKVVVADASQHNFERPPVGFLLDAPCSATGTGRKNVDVMRRQNGAQMEAELIETTKSIWSNCLTWGAKVAVFSTCSLSEAEGEKQVNWILGKGGVKIDMIKEDEVPGFADSINDRGCLRVFPNDASPGGRDGFFICRFIFD